MPDIRQILAALDDNDKQLWSFHRTEMRRSYMTAHSETLGLTAWNNEDDAFLDLIDIKLALIFERAGKFQTAKDLVGNDADRIEADIENAIKEFAPKPNNGKLIPTGWPQPNGVGK